MAKTFLFKISFAATSNTIIGLYITKWLDNYI